MIQIFARFAQRLYPWRWRFAAITIGTWLALAVLMFVPQIQPFFPAIAAALVGPLFVIPWGITCMCIWFHPEHGNLMNGAFISRLPRVIAGPIRFYFAAFLVLWFAVGLAVSPMLLVLGSRSWA
jgi:hypothetical protein